MLLNMKKEYLLPASIVIAGLMISIVIAKPFGPEGASAVLDLEAAVLPVGGVELPIVWGDLGQKLVENGAIDLEKFKAVYAERGGLTEEDEKLLVSKTRESLKITAANSGYLLNLFWALGLASENPILETGEMTAEIYGGDPSRFASTGGWTLARGDPMDHYSKHQFFNLTPEQQALVDRVSKNIYRPCCNNSTHFPDCNHGMAMLGFLELAASQGVSEAEMYKAALAVNAYWFPDTYLTIAQYLANQGRDWTTADPKELLGANYSSGSGSAQIASQVTVPGTQRGGGCSV